MDTEAIKAEGDAFLRPLLGGCERCQIRRRSSFGWVYEACGLCVRKTPSKTYWFQQRVVKEGWLEMPKWGAKYLAGDANGPLPVPWVTYQTLSGYEGPLMAAPAWVVRLLLVGNPMKAYVRAIGGLAIQWPRVFALAARDEAMRAAMDACLLLSGDGATPSGAPAPEAAPKLYTFLLELDDSVFGGVAQENTMLKPVTGSKKAFGPPVRVLGKVVR